MKREMVEWIEDWTNGKINRKREEWKNGNGKNGKTKERMEREIVEWRKDCRNGRRGKMEIEMVELKEEWKNRRRVMKEWEREQ